MKQKKYILLLILHLLLLQSQGQDTAKTLSLEQLKAIVKQYHPVARQADILVEKAKADLIISRGNFDPVLSNDAAGKTFDGTRYYNYNRPELTIPTWFGIEVKAGLEYLGGNRTSPEETNGESSYLGVKAPLAKNLLMDKRRATLQTAKIFKQMSFVEKRNILNDLLLEAVKSYWTWVQEYQVYKILNDAVLVNEQRLKMVITASAVGERPAIDTVEALSQLQAFELLKAQAWLGFKNAGLELSIHLWEAGGEPYELPDTIEPEVDLQQLNINSIPIPSLDSMLNAALGNHPELIMYNYKLGILAIEKKLKFQDLLPDVSFRYNQLGRGYDVLKTATGPLFENNFQYGFSLSIPLRLSQGRGEYKKARLKIDETRLQRNYKQVGIQNKVKRYFNELLALQYQVNLQQKAFENYFTLQRGEETRFRNGESSLFLINTRETKTLEALQKLQELKTKFFKTAATLQWAAGLQAQ